MVFQSRSTTPETTKRSGNLKACKKELSPSDPGERSDHLTVYSCSSTRKRYRTRQAQAKFLLSENAECAKDSNELFGILHHSEARISLLCLIGIFATE